MELQRFGTANPMAYAATAGNRRSGRSGILGRALMMAAGLCATGLAGAPIAYMLWPAPTPISADAPSLPISIGGVAFNVPPAAIRFKVQRRTGAQPRVDMAFVWPTLTPPDPTIEPKPTDRPDVTDRLFVTVAAADSTLPPLERLKTIYPRYLEAAPVIGADGLSLQGFRESTPYQGEDLIYDPGAPERFLLRCTRQVGNTPAMCLHERRISGADLTVRFPRAWLSEWHAVADGIDRLIGGFKPMPMPG
jgi:hypothetical protein